MKTNMLGKIALAIKHIGKTRLDHLHQCEPNWKEFEYY